MFHAFVEEINHREIRGEVIAERQRKDIVQMLMRLRGHRAVGAPMVPVYFPSTSLERKAGLHLVTGELPRTRLLAENALELEALRLLALWGGSREDVRQLLGEANERLEKLCFSSFCHVGECKVASVAYLRFWSAYRPEDIAKQSLFAGTLVARSDENGLWSAESGYVTFYSLLALTGCAPAVAQSALSKSAPAIAALLLRAELDEPFALIRMHVLRNALVQVPGYEEFTSAHFSQDKRGRWRTHIPKRPASRTSGTLLAASVS